MVTRLGVVTRLDVVARGESLTDRLEGFFGVIRSPADAEPQASKQLPAINVGKTPCRTHGKRIIANPSFLFLTNRAARNDWRTCSLNFIFRLLGLKNLGQEFSQLGDVLWELAD